MGGPFYSVSHSSAKISVVLVKRWKQLKQAGAEKGFYTCGQLRAELFEMLVSEHCPQVSEEREEDQTKQTTGEVTGQEQEINLRKSKC